ncbi:hypothetical protein TGVAND_243700 [Toxoplasma gondii VAND]|uniref:Uncharacterized protein n=2 Tax=Toxoplasma gondii TaxID=5811 RepID=A0A086QNJ0_TOXGO|nr:hypothetical protein TGVAND_243700 [Toxoplasma gondii VAND]KFH14172.1 hypothetical protein TGMAS_243700 [Toxoplasma gondii MAS]
MKPSNRCPHSNTQRSAFLRACRLHAIKHKRSVNTSELGAQTRTVELGKTGYSGEHVTKGQRLMRNNGNACRLSRSKSTSMVTRHRSSSQVFHELSDTLGILSSCSCAIFWLLPFVFSCQKAVIASSRTETISILSSGV